MDSNKASDMEKNKYQVKVIALIVLLLVAVIAGAIFIIPFHWPFGFIVWLVLFVILGLYFLIRWHAKNTAYICPECNYTFAISTLTDFLSPNLIDKKLLKCPECGVRSACKEVSIHALKEKISRIEEKKEIKTKPARSLYVQVGIVILLYLILWAYTLYIYSKLPHIIPTHFDLSLKPDDWGPRSSILILPIIAAIFPAFQGMLCFYAENQGYRSAIYYFLTGVNIFCLLIFLGIQYLTLLRAM